jgi:hypothetical protein
VRAVVEAERGQLVVPAFVVTETDYLIRTRLEIDVGSFDGIGTSISA